MSAVMENLRRCASTSDACITGTPMVPISQETLQYVIALHDELLDTLETAITLIEDAEKDTNWVSGDPYGDGATVKMRSLVAKAKGSS